MEFWSGLLCPPPGDLPDSGIKPSSVVSPASAGRFITTMGTWEAPTDSIVSNKGFISHLNTKPKHSQPIYFYGLKLSCWIQCLCANCLFYSRKSKKDDTLLGRWPQQQSQGNIYIAVFIWRDSKEYSLSLTLVNIRCLVSLNKAFKDHSQVDSRSSHRPLHSL